MLGAVLLFAAVATFSAAESRFSCVGAISREAAPKPITIFIKLNEYRWWVGLWSDSDGDLHLEIPNESVEYFGHVVEVGDQLQIFDFDRKMQGNFSTLSKALALQTRRGFFDGKCNRA